MLNKTSEMIKGYQYVATLNEHGRRLELQCLETLEALDAFEEEWNTLAALHSEGSSCFQTFRWCREYHQQFSKDMTNRHSPLPQIFVLREETRPIMIWPLMKINSRTGLKLLTCSTEPIGKYTAVLHDASSFDETIGQSVLDAIISHANVDCVSINHYPHESTVDKIIGENGYREKSQAKSFRFDLETYTDWNDFQATNLASQPKEISHQHMVYDQHSDEFRSLVDWVISNKINMLKAKGESPGILSEQGFRQMMQSLSLKPVKEANCETKTLQIIIHCLYSGTELVRAEIGILHQGCYVSYLSACNHDFQDESCENALLECIQKWAFEHSLKAIDFMYEVNELQKSQSNQSMSLKSTNLPVTLKGKIYAIAWKTYLRPTIKSLLKR